MNITEKLAKVQRELKAPKYRMNKFGGYAYRSCEDIMEAIKPCMPAGCVVTVSDEITAVADRVYVKATARFTDGEASVEVTAFAREADARKGMDDSQVTGSASSYARKFALNGLFMIDDNKDADAESPKQDDANEIAKPLDSIKSALKAKGKSEADFCQWFTAATKRAEPLQAIAALTADELQWAARKLEAQR